MPDLLSIRRYPVKGCAGEDLRAVDLDGRGLVGDRLWAVRDRDGRLASGKDSRRFRRMDAVFELAARLRSDVAEVGFPDGTWHRADTEAAAARLRAHFGRDVRLAPEADVPHMDEGGVSLVGTASLRALADLTGSAVVDPRHFRVNLLVETDEPWVEEAWVGRRLHLGSAEVRVVEPIPRCRMVDIAQDGVAAHGSLLQTLGQHRAARLAVLLEVTRPGTVGAGDVVELL